MRQVVLDVDTGCDDALALLLAVRHPDLNVRAVSCVAGNAPIDLVVRNTLVVLDHAGAGDVAVAAGADRPLLAPAIPARHVHGADGLADLGLPDPRRRHVGDHAVTVLRRAILDSPEPVTVVALAPLTNIALLLRTHPEVAANIDRIVFMGGSAGIGNATPVAEFNIWHDPEAAAIVLGSGVPATMYGLDVFYRVGILPDEVEKLVASEDTGARLAGRLLAYLARSCANEERIRVPGAANIGDAGAVCAVADPGGLVTRPLPVTVGLTAGPARGQTIVDRRTGPVSPDSLDIGAATVDVALEVDAERYRRLFLDIACRGAG